MPQEPETKIVRRAMLLGDGSLSIVLEGESLSFQIARGFTVSVNGLQVEGNPSMATWKKVGHALRVIERGLQFAIGDYVNMVEARFGEDASEIISEETGWSLKTIQVYSWLAGRILQANRRMDRLGVAHHLEVATLPHEDQRQWLNAAAADDEDEPWTKAKLRASLAARGEAMPTAFWVLVAATSVEDQTMLMEQLTSMGRATKALVKHTK